MHKQTYYSLNPFAVVMPTATAGVYYGYDGYLDVYDPSSNPGGHWRNPAPSGYTTAQTNTNNALPKFPKLLNVQMGAIINFQLVLREVSLGVHNPM